MISDEYREVLRASHEAYPNWGNGHGERNLPKVLEHVKPGDTVLDYGCGKGSLIYALRGAGYVASGYDPGVDEWAQRPRHNYDLLVSFDVLEHIEPRFLDAVLMDMHGLAKRALLNVSLIPAKKILTDGRNAHLIVEPVDWWMGKLERIWGDGRLLHVDAKEATWLCLR